MKTTSKTNLKNQIKNLLTSDQLRWKCPEDMFDFNSTAELEPLDEIVGQDRAIESIKLGAQLQAKGFNIFVTGLSGTGRLTTVQKILNDIKLPPKEIFDYCYVNNFKNSNEPILLKFKQGLAVKFSEQMQDLISFLRSQLPKLFESEDFQKGKRKIIEAFQDKEKDTYSEFDEKTRNLGFARAQYSNEYGVMQMDIFPVIEGEPIHIDDLETFIAKGKVSPERVKELKSIYPKLRNELLDLIRVSFKEIQEFRKSLAEYDKISAEQEIKIAIDDLKKEYNDEKIDNYLDDVADYVKNHLSIFLENPQNEEQIEALNNAFRVFAVNIVLDNSQSNEVPVVVETTATYSNIFGSIERVFDRKGGYWRTDFTKINAGSLLKANKGFLIVNSEDLFSEAGTWAALKRVLLYDKLEIMNFDNFFQFSQATLKPEPIDIDVKIVIIGGSSLYQILYHYEKGFKKIFKVHAQFDNQTVKTDDIIMSYAKFLCKISNEEKLPHCDKSGVAAIVEWAVANAGSQNKITLHFTDVADVLRESSLIIDDKEKLITREVVEKALEQRAWRNNLLDEKIKQNIEEGYMLIDTQGERIGQINALTVYNNGINSFGKPARITATVSPGNSGIINIEREADLSGDIHNKGVLIISAFLREKFSCESPMALTATIAFEQSYGGIDGDSASAAEIYALLSALAEVPINQSIAITGSVNQKGDIQPIGGVNEKITGFFEICRDRGLTGEQGILIPHQNVKDLMLNKEIIDAVENKKFKIYALKNIEDGAEILMNLPTGKKNSNGEYPKGSLYFKVIERIKILSALSEKQKDKEKARKK